MDNDFKVLIDGKDIMADETPDGTEIVTSSSDKEFATYLQKSQESYKKYSYILGGIDNSYKSLSINDINELSKNIQQNILDILKANKIIHDYINKDGIIGKVYECIDIYTNTDYNIIYPINNNSTAKDKKMIQSTIKPLIDYFNETANIEKIIKRGNTTSYMDGNFVTYLRTDANGSLVVDDYPIGLVEISEFNINGEPVILFNVDKLRTSLRPISRKKKNGKDIFFDTAKDIVKNNYPEEVYNAYISNEKYAILNPDRTGLVRINNLNSLYGLSPIFKSLKYVILLDTIELSDEITVKAKAKKIIHQSLRKELGGDDGKDSALSKMQYAHDNLLAAWKNKTVLTTTPWYVEKISYVEPKTDITDVQTLNSYRTQVFMSLGIQFLDSYNSTINVSKITLDGLMKVVDSLSEQIGNIINRYYKLILKENNIDLKYLPKIQISTSEIKGIAMKKDLASFLLTTMGSSYQTAYNVLGISDIETEAMIREKEATDGTEKTMIPHSNFYTQTNDNSSPGRPSTNPDQDKKAYDKARNSKGGGVSE